MFQDMDLIYNAPLLSSLPRHEIVSNLQSGKFRTLAYPKGSVLHLEGEPCKKLEVILSGKVMVDRIDESGNLLTISKFVSGDTLGGNILFSTNPHYPLTVSALMPSEVLEIDKDVLFELCCNNPVFLETFLEHISDHAFILGDTIRYHVQRTIRESVLTFLQREQQRQNTNRIRLNMTKKALADRFGVQRTSLSRELAKMRDEGLISFDKDTITLL